MKNFWPIYSKTEINKVKQVVRSNLVNYWTGNEGKKFEKEFSNYFKIKYSLTVANASLGLECVLKAIGIKKNDHVVVTSKSYISSASCVSNVGAIPIFADVDYNSQNITAKTIKPLITKKTKAIICVHLGGYPCDMNEIIKICKKKKIKIIEDCSQAHGSKIGNKHVGTFGSVAIWSFCNDKILSTLGEGGMISTNSKFLFEKIWYLKEIGKNYRLMNKKFSNDIYRWIHNNFGTNLRMTEVQSAIGRLQLRSLNNFIKKRNYNAKKILNCCKKFKSIIIPHIEKKITHAFYRCYIKINKDKLKTGWSRNKIIHQLIKRNVPCNEGSCSELYREKSFKKNNLGPKKRLINAKKLGETSIAFQVHPGINLNDLKKILLSIEKVFETATKS